MRDDAGNDEALGTTKSRLALHVACPWDMLEGLDSKAEKS